MDYQAGRTRQELAEQYGLARSTIIQLLRKHGVAVRYSRVTPAEAAEMVQLYRAGMRQIDIAARLGRDPSSVWHVLRRAVLSMMAVGPLVVRRQPPDGCSRKISEVIQLVLSART